MTTATKKPLRITIVDGGNKFELFQQLMNIGLRDDHDRMITLPYFRVKVRPADLLGSMASHDDHLQVTGIQAEGNSGDSWIIQGYFPKEAPGSVTRRIGGTFKGSYNTRTRQGFIEMTHTTE